MNQFKIILYLLLIINLNIRPQDIPYGTNEKNGRYVNVGDAKIYYEVYGEGQPVILLHGGFGYIDGFKKYIPLLSKDFKVIAIASRGYGKSEIGYKKFTYSLLAEDVKKVIEKECTSKVIIIGNSDGAMISYIIASRYPEIVSKIVSMGGPLGTSGYNKEALDWLKNFNSQEFESYRPDLIKIMPQPERLNEFSENLKEMWSEPVILKPDDLNKIMCSVLLLVGDRDLYCSTEHIVQIYRDIHNAQLAIFPNSTHSAISFRNTLIFDQYISKFISSE